MPRMANKGTRMYSSLNSALGSFFGRDLMMGMGEVVWGGRAVIVIMEVEVDELKVELDAVVDVDVDVDVSGRADEVEDSSKESNIAGVALVVVMGPREAAGVCGG
jgi:hypothetical protein